MERTVGFIGVGSFASYLVEALCREPAAPPIILSPRNGARAGALARRFGARVAADNQAVVDAAEIVILTPPADEVTAIADRLTWRADQRVVTMAAGVRLERLRAASRPATLRRAMANSSAVIGESPVFLTPADPAVAAVLARLGPVETMADDPASRSRRRSSSTMPGSTG